MSKPSRSHSSSSYSDEIEKLFRYTRGRWLYNERECELHFFFCHSFCLLKPSPASHKIQKLTYVIPVSILRNLRGLHVKPREPVLARSLQSLKKASFHFLSYVDYSSTLGFYNKAFCLMLDNSLRVIARMPCPLAGPSYLVTASEVATLQFVKEVLKLPVPRVITWSGAKRGQMNPVGADFIIMEEVPGVCLGERWLTFESPDDVTPIMTGILDMETKFESLRFSRIGSHYFKEDVSADLQTVPLLSGAIDTTTRQLAEGYRVGPLTNCQWWRRGNRAHMTLDRGPCM